ncbi:ECF transporter S component [Clostridium manihotivorum]|uniref:ECF transporter S component n=1 Tax=Clostridium manihotivorum TaxID=2320868 RepID=A0A3R5R0U0_9CLOT|nr:ECF transporter S component [Clostridium manihotivorum]QAA34048.1 ECF transporter S component [Clostridium manihotivorum]
MNKTKNLTYIAVLAALAILIPITFGFASITLGPFTATLGAHVPIFLSMFVSPFAAIAVGICNAIGFFIAGKPIWVVLRAFMHVFVGLAGALMIKKGVSYGKTVAFTSPIHATLESLAVMPFPGFNFKGILITVFIGTLIHHFVDGTITYVLVEAISKATRKDFRKVLAGSTDR